jgi:hypothetical protein
MATKQIERIVKNVSNVIKKIKEVETSDVLFNKRSSFQVQLKKHILTFLSFSKWSFINDVTLR